MHLRLTLDHGLAVAELQRIDDACDRFESAWRGGGQPDLESFLAGFAGPARTQLLSDLLALELDLRLEQGDMPDDHAYRQRFPGHEDIIDAVLGPRGKTDDLRLEQRLLETGEPTVDGPVNDRPTIDGPANDELTTAAPGSGRGTEIMTGDGESAAPRPGRSTTDGYEIVAELGRGGMGIVYQARQTALNRLVALKVIKSAEFASAAELIRFQNEAEAVAQLDHPNIVPIYEVGQRAGQRFFSMKLVPGSSLDKKLGDFVADVTASARLVATIAGAIQHAHERGILHRDLKPANILLDERGQPHVTDFGLARQIATESGLTNSGYPVGTPSYMSPEQVKGEKGSFTTATDVYGLGSILYALLTGHAPFLGSSLAETLDRVRDDAPRPPAQVNARVPRDLEIICLKCLEKDPQRRYSSARALADDLKRWLSGEPIEARSVGPATRAWMWCRRNPLPAALGALCVMAVLGGLAGVTWKWREAAAANDETQTMNSFLIDDLLAQAAPRSNPRGAGLTVGELLDITSSKLGKFENRPAVEASIRRTLGSAYHSLGLYDRAEPHFQAAIALDSRVHGPNDRQTLRDVNLLTSVLDDAARYAEAEQLARRNLESCIASLGRYDSTSLDAEYQLGALLGHLGKLDDAERFLRECTAAQRRVLGAQQPDTLRSINELGLLLQDRGRLDEADSLAIEYEHGIRCLFGTKHPDNVTALASRGRVRFNQGRLDEAEMLYESAEAEASRILGTEHPRTLAAMADHARVLRTNGKRADAQRLLEQAWELARSRRGLDDADTLKAASLHAQSLLEAGNVQQAGQLLNLVLPRCQAALGRDHPTTQRVQDLAARVSSAAQSALSLPEQPFDDSR
jgi:tetratricopeptide (TPR) repeat protein